MLRQAKVETLLTNDSVDVCVSPGSATILASRPKD